MTFRELQTHPSLKGIALMSCAAKEDWEGDRRAGNAEVAHAHFGGRYKGWACFRSLADFNATSLRHEIGHLIREDKKHDQAWRDEVVALGGRVEARYRKR